MTPNDYFWLGFTTGLGLGYVFWCVIQDIRSIRNDRLLFLKWKEKARYWIGY